MPIGYLPRDPGFAIPERHLGLHLADEAWTAERIIQLADWIESHLDLEQLLRLSAERSAPAVQPVTALVTSPMRARIGIARDAAFCFYYEDNLRMLRGLGAELVEFSPIADRTLPPELDGLYLGGGYPELHASALAANTSMQAAVREFVAGDAPVYAECGGFMYLTEAIVDVEGQRWPMAGIFPTSVRMQRRLAKLGYVEVEGVGDEDWFRYSTIDPMPARIQRVYRDPVEGYRARSVLGSYAHLHFRSCPAFATRFVKACLRERAVDVESGLQPGPGGAGRPRPT